MWFEVHGRFTRWCFALALVVLASACRGHGSAGPRSERVSQRRTLATEQNPTLAVAPGSDGGAGSFADFAFVDGNSPERVRRLAASVLMVFYLPREFEKFIKDKSRLKPDRMYVYAPFLHECMGMSQTVSRLGIGGFSLRRMVNPPQDRAHVWCLSSGIGSGFMADLPLVGATAAERERGVFVSAAHVFAGRKLSDFVVVPAITVDRFGPPQLHWVETPDGRSGYLPFISFALAESSTLESPLMYLDRNGLHSPKPLAAFDAYSDVLVTRLTRDLRGSSPLPVASKQIWNDGAEVFSLGYGETSPLRITRGVVARTSPRGAVAALRLPMWGGMSGGPTIMFDDGGNATVIGINVRSRREQFELVYLPTMAVLDPAEVRVKLARDLPNLAKLTENYAWQQNNAKNMRLEIPSVFAPNFPELMPYFDGPVHGKHVVETSSDASAIQTLPWLVRQLEGGGHAGRRRRSAARGH